MPPSRRSSSSGSSRSRSSSRSHSRSSSSRRHSSSSHSSSYRRTYHSSASVSRTRSRSNQPQRVPTSIRSKAILMRCKNHDYIYYDESWRDETTGILYQKGYYDEDGNFYDGNSIAFKKPDGSYEAHYKCDFCDTELETNWKEGFYPTCKNCGAEMNKTPVYIDEIVNVGKTTDTGNLFGLFSKRLGIYIALSAIVPMFFVIMMPALMFRWASVGNSWDEAEEEQYEYAGEDEEQETNLEIYGTDVYLDEISHNTYRICSEQDEYEKHITWDYGAKSYYDYDSDCYLWYNTDVSPNLWQYWYESVAGSNYYGWMECEGDKWYIEVSDTEWEEYNGDTSQLWHIENAFDQ